MHHYHSYDNLIANNARWASDKLNVDPEYFNRLSEDQRPPFLFVGCSDSRMPIDTYTQTEPGELFIHRNIANQISLTDMNFLSVLEYAVEVLKVKHVIICGHYKCGGIEAAYSGKARGVTENWVTQIKDIARYNRAELESIADKDERLDRRGPERQAMGSERLLARRHLTRPELSGGGRFCATWLPEDRCG